MFHKVIFLGMKLWQENLATVLSTWKIHIFVVLEKTGIDWKLTEEEQEAKWLVKQPSIVGLMHLKVRFCGLGFQKQHFVTLFTVEKNEQYSIFWHCLKFTGKHTYLSEIRLIIRLGWVCTSINRSQHIRDRICAAA